VQPFDFSSDELIRDDGYSIEAIRTIRGLLWHAVRAKNVPDVVREMDGAFDPHPFRIVAACCECYNPASPSP
jgi:hypothetical protein